MRPKDIITVPNQQGESLSVVGDTYRLMITGEQTDGRFALIDMLVPPGGGPGPHAHAAIAESFYVVEGEVVVRSETQTYTARKGDLVTIPMGGAIHNFRNESDQMAHLVCMVVPAGLDAMFVEMGQPVEAGTFLPPPPMTSDRLEHLQKLAQKYGQELFPPDYFDQKSA